MYTPNEKADGKSAASGSTPTAGGGGGTTATTTHTHKQPSMTLRARRRREEAVRCLVGDVVESQNDWKIASIVCQALEQGLDRDVHVALVQEQKDNATRIGQTCHDHADVFLASVAQVAALGEPSTYLSQSLQEAKHELQTATAGPMLQAATTWEAAHASHAKACQLTLIMEACQSVAVHLERARKAAASGRPRVALQAVELARRSLAQPIVGGTTSSTALAAAPPLSTGGASAADKDAATAAGKEGESKEDAVATALKVPSNVPTSLEQTPFGRRALTMLPKIETEVLMGARRGLNRWFVSLRTGGDGAKIGRAVLRQVSHAVALGPGQLGLGGHLPPAYVWRAKTADNLIARVDQNGKVARAVRQGYWFERDAPKEADRLETMSREGMERRAEALAAAFGWFRCWDSDADLIVDPIEFMVEGADLGGSRHGMSGSRHGLSGSRHGLRGSRHGKGRSLGFRASTSSRSQAYQEITSTLGGVAGTGNKAVNATSKWSEVLNPPMLVDNNPSAQQEEDTLLVALPESVHPVRRAEISFKLLGRSDEFIHYYEQNRFGEMKIGEGGKDDKKEQQRSALSSLTGDDVSVGTDRIFFNKTIPHLFASVAGFTAVEAALEMSNFVEDDDEDDKDVASGGVVTLNASRFRESSERYERLLLSELGGLWRSRAKRAQLHELVKSSTLTTTLRAALKVVHSSSSTRRHDKELIALDLDVLMTALKIAQDEQLKATAAIVMDDRKVPMLVADHYGSSSRQQPPQQQSSPKKGIPDPEEMGLPFGLGQMKQVPQKTDLDFQEQVRTSFNRAAMDEAFTFSSSVPVVLRSLHARIILCSAFALSQEEAGQTFPEKKGSNAAGYVLDCVEECVNVAAVGMKDSDNTVDEGSVEKAVQVMANISALQHTLPRLFGTVMRGLCHVGLIRADEIEDSFAYAERTLRGAEKSCDSQVGSAYSLIYEISRNKIDSHINYALENFNWVAKAARELPNAYCDGLVGYMRSVFSSLGPMDEGSRAGLHFSCCGHVSERLVKLLSGKPGDTATMDDSGIAPITRIDAFGIKNLNTDCEELEKFAESTGIPQLRDCFNELRVLTTLMLDKELPTLLLSENAAQRRRKYPILSMEKVLNILEKYVGTGLGDKLMGGSRKVDILFIDKKEVQQLIKIVKPQVH